MFKINDDFNKTYSVDKNDVRDNFDIEVFNKNEDINTNMIIENYVVGNNKGELEKNKKDNNL